MSVKITYDFVYQHFVRQIYVPLSMTPEQKKSGMAMLIMSPAMIVVFSFMSPAGVALYWAVGGFVIVIQQIIITFIMKPRMRFYDLFIYLTKYWLLRLE